MIPHLPNLFASGPMHDLLDHLWQSTAFGSLIALIAFAFRKSPARVRFWLWMVASAKFLVPFSALVWIGKHSGWSAISPATVRWSFTFEEFSRPFSQPRMLLVAAPHPGGPATNVVNWLGLIWIAGIALVLGVWALRWFRMRRLVRAMSPVRCGLFTEILGRLGGPSQRVRLCAAPSTLEPGVFGVFRPTLVIPEGIEHRLTDAQVEGVLRHELEHVRRRDNLFAALQMVVEAVFWFHPLVWWLGSRMFDDRERACDEAVLEQFNQPRAYAQGILRVCEHYLESPMPCVAGVTGANLRKRIENIMTQTTGNRLTMGRKLLLWITGAAAIAGPIAFGVMNAPLGRAQSTEGAPKEFEVASIKPMEPAMHGLMRVEIQMAPGGRYIAKGVTLKLLLQQAYGVRDFQIVGAPSWAQTERYEINAKAGDGQIRREDLRPLLQSLLADRFKVTVRRETKEMPVYELVVGKGGPKMKEAESGPESRDMVRMGRGMMELQSASMTSVANALSNQLGRSVIDKTGLTKKYDFKLEWTPDESQNAMIRQMHPDGPPAPPVDGAGPSIYTAVQEQLGLKLENGKGPVEVLFIERAEKPTEN